MGNLAPEGSVVKSTSIDPSVIGPDGIFHHLGPARVFVSEEAAIHAIKNGEIRENDVVVLVCGGPAGAGMEEIYQITSALKWLPVGQARSAAHRCPLQRCLHRRLPRAYLARSPGRRSDRQADRWRPDRNHHRPREVDRVRQPGGRCAGTLQRRRRSREVKRPRRPAPISGLIPHFPTTLGCGRRWSRPAAGSGEDASTTSTRSSPGCNPLGQASMSEFATAVERISASRRYL